MSKMPLRMQLTLIYGLVIGIALATSALLIHTLLAQDLMRELDDALAVRSAELHRALNITDEGFDTHRLTSRNLQVPVNEFAVAGIYIQVLDDRGLEAAVSANLHDQRLPVDPAIIADGLAAKPSLVTLPAAQGVQLRVLTTPMIHGERVVGLLQVAASLYAVDAALRNLGYELILGASGTWLLALLLGWWITGRALWPVAAISAMVERIAATGDVGQRIAYRGAQDQVGDLAATFNRMLDRIERTFAAHRQFVTDSSHQLGTPLTVIRGNAELLERAGSPEDREECIAAIKTEVERMDKVVGDLLTLAQLDARPALARRRLRLDTLARELVGQVRSAAGNRQILVEAPHPAVVYGDGERLAELLLNLLHNALKYSADGTTVAVRVAASPEHVQVHVADQGIGIPAQDVDRVFDRFYRVKRSYAQAPKGAGLGLAIVKAIAEAHDGKVAVRSAEGQGSEFTVLLPAAGAAAAGGLATAGH